MQNVLIDDRRIWVDFSQSVSKLHGVWVKQREKRASKGLGGSRMSSRFIPPPRGDQRDLLLDMGEMTDAASRDRDKEPRKQDTHDRYAHRENREYERHRPSRDDYYSRSSHSRRHHRDDRDYPLQHRRDRYGGEREDRRSYSRNDYQHFSIHHRKQRNDHERYSRR